MSKKKWLGLALVAIVAVIGGGLWWWLRDDAPPAANLDTAAIAAASAQGSAGGASGAFPANPDGVWAIDPSVGKFDDFTSSYIGYRVDEVLSTIGNKTVVGRTPQVTGTVTAVDVTGDLRQLTTDSSLRDNRARGALDTERFPNATFKLSSPLDFGQVPADGATLSVKASGQLTVKGVSKPVEVSVEAKRVGAIIAVVGKILVVFADYGINKPTAPIVVSLDDHGSVEFQLFFRKQ